jgi:hypothetical protein
MEITKDISIGKNKWIKWIEIDPTATDTNIDDKLLKTKSFWTYLETECVAGCCGIDAFAFWSEDIKIAKEKFNDPYLREYLEELKKEIQNAETVVISSYFLNNNFHKNLFIDLIDHLLKNVK